METRRLRLLLELSRRGSMRDVADAMHLTTSTVSQQLAVLAKEAGATLLEPEGRRVRLTPAGRRLAEHAVTILAAVDAARLDLDPGAVPSGEVRVAGFATAVRRSLLPAAAVLARDHPRVRLRIHEHEPSEAFALLAADAVDLALTYDYNLAPAAFDATVETVPLWSAPWGLAVPAAAPGSGFADFATADWIVNSRNTADEEVVRTVASLEGVVARIAHRADSLDLVEDLIVAGLGVGLLPADRPAAPGVRLLPLPGTPALLRSWAVVRRGRAGWPPLALMLRLLRSVPTA
ncbi:LysR family transcriptional regulator [Couchioplanes caeruleus]|uniref:LysR family transcriptional regulator n=2 Tax=Couchioplanes caeruleus TaxID=56438 RepID=A0A1K0GUH8_9ACTN|nr:LysR family transcriptional regulator [Couchioplanes caeruleus]OJF14980.1 LysR family transcriptional regulator [Couchioplanes caeruleus subsp. caeruleus]ROP27480.1 LysR family transcriptional regulator [Couchioplanes caeruleus]